MVRPIYASIIRIINLKYRKYSKYLIYHSDVLSSVFENIPQEMPRHVFDV